MPKTWSGKQSVSILAVSDIYPTEYGSIILELLESGLMSYEEAKRAIVTLAREKRDKDALSVVVK
jgi:hypothetical protein